MRCLPAILTLVISPFGALAADPAPDIKGTINRGLTFLAKDNLAWKEKRKCAECHHAPFTLWALNEGKKQGYAVDEQALADLTSWAVSNDHLARLVAKPPKQEQIVVSAAPLLLALGIESGSARATQDGLKKMLTSILNDQDKDGSWKLVPEFRPIGASPDTVGAVSLSQKESCTSPFLSSHSCRMNAVNSSFSSLLNFSSRIRLKNSTVSSNVIRRPSCRYGGVSLMPRNGKVLMGPSADASMPLIICGL